MILRLILIGLIAALQAPDAESGVSLKKSSSTCMVFAVDRSWLNVNFHFFSTRDLNLCDEKSFAPVTNESAKAQLLLLYPNAEFRTRGPYFQLADFDLSNVNKSYVDIGKLKFSLIGEAKFNILDILKNASGYQQVRKGNFTYLPTPTTGTVNLLWLEGSSLYELISPNGEHYTMTSGSYILRDENFGINLNNLGNFLNLPKGWRFEKRITDKIFRVYGRELGGEDQVSVIDELGNLYIANQNLSTENISK
jgi:hypothetical protein